MDDVGNGSLSLNDIQRRRCLKVSSTDEVTVERKEIEILQGGRNLSVALNRTSCCTSLQGHMTDFHQGSQDINLRSLSVRSSCTS
ncbi:hypothetical protein M758_2G118000 [Ceratodon purpureus]|nr:hypothetical protein M758_2G118000 [Ceratodon purpureus]